MTPADFSDSLSGDMINFTRAFDSAWERMMIILFRPFDLGKWFAIGFSAFLAGLLQGGNGFNGSFNTNNVDDNTWNKTSTVHLPKFDWSQFNANLNNAIVGLQVGMIVLIVALVFIVVFGLMLLIYWLGARGQFMFLDNLVRNRGAISLPWTHYARQGNSLFGLYLLFLLISFLVFLPILIVAIVMAWPLFQHQRWPVGGEIAGFVLLGLIYFTLGIFFAVILFIFREFGVPIMFRNGLMARPAFWVTMNLFKEHAGSIAVFVLLRIALFIALVILSYIACCLTCCVGILPYLGTVVLLPALVYIRCFSLDCLAQFGPEYDVWTVDVLPTSPAPPTPPAPSHHSDKFNPVAVLQRATWPLLSQESLAIEFDQQSPCVESAFRREFAQRGRRADLARAAIDEDAQPTLDCF